MKRILCIVQMVVFLCAFASGVQAKDFSVRLDVEGLPAAPRVQDDFYLHVNYDWMKNTPLPADAGRVDGFSDLNRQVRAQLQTMTENAAQRLQAGTANHDEQNIAALYACIQDEAGRSQTGLGKLAEPLRQIENIQTVQEYVNQMARLSHDFGTPGLIGSFTVDNDPYENALNVIWLNPPDTGLRHAYLADAANEAYFAYYQEYIRDILIRYGRRPAEAEQSAREIFALQQDLARHSLPAGQLYNTVDAVHPLDLPKLQRIYSAVDVHAMLQAGGIAPENGVQGWYISDPPAIRRVNQLLTAERLPAFKEYAIFKLLSEHSACLDTSYAGLTQLYKQQMSGAAEAKSEERVGMDLCERLLEESYGRQYAGQYFTPEDCAEVRGYAGQILAAYRKKLQNITWLSKPTINKAVRKLDTMKLNIGYPDAWPEYLDTDTVLPPSAGGSLIDNVLLLEESRRRAALASVGKPVRRDLWRGMVPQTVNAFYSAADNSINFPAGILQAPLYDKKAPVMQNLGGIGMLIAHEITHSIDSSGAQYDEKGRIRNWWTSWERQTYAYRQRTIARFYGRYVFPDGSRENGWQTLIENTADLGALSCLTDMAAGDKEKLRQLYTSFAVTWRDKMTPAKFRALLTDEHAISPVRVNAVLSASDAFYEAFDVRLGDDMYVEPGERPRLW